MPHCVRYWCPWGDVLQCPYGSLDSSNATKHIKACHEDKLASWPGWKEHNARQRVVESKDPERTLVCAGGDLESYFESSTAEELASHVTLVAAMHRELLGTDMAPAR
jgi:hypothetical protein